MMAFMTKKLFVKWKITFVYCSWMIANLLVITLYCWRAKQFLQKCSRFLRIKKSPFEKVIKNVSFIKNKVSGENSPNLFSFSEVTQADIMKEIKLINKKNY